MAFENVQPARSSACAYPAHPADGRPPADHGQRRVRPGRKPRNVFGHLHGYSVRPIRPAGDDLAKTETLTFLPGEPTKSIVIQVKGDEKIEGDEYFDIDIFGNSDNTLLAKKRGIGTILNDDSRSRKPVADAGRRRAVQPLVADGCLSWSGRASR